MTSAKAARNPRIVFFGLFGAGNFGNDGSLETVLSSLRRKVPQASFLCVCGDASLVGQRFGIEATPIRIAATGPRLLRRLDKLCLTLPGRVFDFAHAIRTLSGADIMIVPGTGILDDFGEKPHQMPLSIALWCLAARLTGTRIAYVSTGAGPINHPLNRLLMLSAARMAHYRSFRDENSRAYLARFGIDTRQDPVTPDVVFNLPAPASERPPDGRITVGLGVMDYRGWYSHDERGAEIYQSYVKRLSAFATYLIEEGYRIRLLIGQESDEVAVRDVIRFVGEKTGSAPEQISQGTCSSLQDLMQEIALTDVVVATRYHNIICALKMGRPSISLEYAAKNTAVMNAVGLEAFCDHVETFTTEGLIRKFEQLKTERENHAMRIWTRVAEFQRSLDGQDNHLIRLIAGERTRPWSSLQTVPPKG